MAGLSIDWDGHNRLGTLTEDAREALEALETAAQCVEEAAVYSADDALGHQYAKNNDISAKTDAELALLARAVCDGLASAADAIVDGGAGAVEKLLREIRADQIAQKEDEA